MYLFIDSLFPYFPKYSGIKDYHSDLIRKFKSNKKFASDYFIKIISQWLKDNMSNTKFNHIIVPIPSSNMNKKNTITKIIPAICHNFDNVIDGSMVITKTSSHNSFCISNRRCYQTILNSTTINFDLIADKHVILLDDITTSGTTFAALLAKFSESNALSISCLAIGKTVKLKNYQNFSSS